MMANVTCYDDKRNVPCFEARHALYFGILFFPVNIGEFFLDIHLFELEVFAQQRPRHIEHLLRVKVDVDGKQLA